MTRTNNTKVTAPTCDNDKPREASEPSVLFSEVDVPDGLKRYLKTYILRYYKERSLVDLMHLYLHAETQNRRALVGTRARSDGRPINSSLRLRKAILQTWQELDAIEASPDTSLWISPSTREGVVVLRPVSLAPSTLPTTNARGTP